MDHQPIPPTADRLAEAVLNLAPRGAHVHLITFTAPAGAIECDVVHISTHTLAEYGLPTVLNALAYSFARHRASGCYDGVIGFGVYDTTTGVTMCADLFGHLAIAIPTGDEPDHRPRQINAAVAEALVAMVIAGPGIPTGRRHSAPGADGDTDTVRRSSGRAEPGGHTTAQ